MKIERSGYSGWNDYPVYRCWTYDTFTKIGKWCYDHGVETFLVAFSGGTGEYRFQVKTHHELFVLKWL